MSLKYEPASVPEQTEVRQLGDEGEHPPETGIARVQGYLAHKKPPPPPRTAIGA